MVNVIKQLNYILSRKQILGCFFLFFISFIGSLFELLGVTAILPLVQLLVDPQKIMNNNYIITLCNVFNIHKERTILLCFVIIIIGVYIIKNIYIIWMYYFQETYIYKLQLDLSEKMMKYMLSKDYQFFLNVNTSVILRSVDNEIGGTVAIIGLLFRIASECLTVLMIGVCLFLSSPMLALCIMGVVCFSVVWYLLFFKKKVRDAGIINNYCAAEVTKTALQAFEGIKDIILLQKHLYFEKLFAKSIEKRGKANAKKAIYDKIPSYVIEATSVSGFVGAIGILILIDVDLTRIIPILALFAVAAFRVIPSAGRISSSMNGILFYRKPLNTTFENFQQLNSEKIKNQEQNLKKLEFNNYINIDNISWKYQNSDGWILNDLSLSIKKGDAVAFIGASGAGKTTLVDIILGLFQPQKGKILVDNKDINEWMNAWHAIVGYVPQNVFLLDDTIRANVAFGDASENIDDDKLWEALESAQLKEYILQLPDKLNTKIGERGTRLSGGQRQRLAIARALYRNAEILVLDEATSALDNETEKAVMESIDALKGKKTMIIVAHRLSTIANCDKIYKIENGIAVEKNKDDIG